MHRVDDGLQVNKRTGEIKTCPHPDYQGSALYEVYGSYSNNKASAMYYCYGVMQDLESQGAKILSYGITSHNTFQFTFAIVFKFQGLVYVRYETARYTRTYILSTEED